MGRAWRRADRSSMTQTPRLKTFAHGSICPLGYIQSSSTRPPPSRRKVCERARRVCRRLLRPPMHPFGRSRRGHRTPARLGPSEQTVRCLFGGATPKNAPVLPRREAPIAGAAPFDADDPNARRTRTAAGAGPLRPMLLPIESAEVRAPFDPKRRERPVEETCAMTDSARTGAPRRTVREESRGERSGARPIASPRANAPPQPRRKTSVQSTSEGTRRPCAPLPLRSPSPALRSPPRPTREECRTRMRYRPFIGGGCPRTDDVERGHDGRS